MSGQQTRQWILANPPAGEINLKGDNAVFKLETKTLPAPGQDEVLVKTLYLSNDPYVTFPLPFRQYI
jgi:NADPH-dependent curcumin reductase CurA